MNRTKKRARHLASVSQQSFGTDGTVVALRGSFDVANAEGLKNAMTGVVDTAVGPLLLDLSEVEWLDSAGIGVIFQLGRQGLALKRTLGMVRPKDAVWEGIEALKLDSLFLVFETRGEAEQHPAMRS